MSQAQDPTPPPPPPPSEGPHGPSGWPAPPARRLTRRSHDRLLGGVASGLAEYLSLDPVIVRLGFVLLALLGGTGVLIYVVGWLLIPEAGTPVGQHVSSARTIAVILLALLLAAVLGGLDLQGQSLLWAVALIGLGVLLFQQNARDEDSTGRAQRPPSAQPGPATDPRPGADPRAGAETAPGTEPGSGPSPGTEPWTRPGLSPAAPPPSASGRLTQEPGPPPPMPPSFPPPPRQRPVLFRLTLGLALLGLGLLGFVDLAQLWVEPSLSDYLALALAVVGVGLLVGAWFGRSRGLIAVGLLLVPTVLGVSLLEDVVPLDWGPRGRRAGVLDIAPEQVEDLRPRYQLAAGKLNLDLTGLADEPDAEPAIDAQVGLGAISVLVPADAEVRVSATAGVGELDLALPNRVVEGGAGLQRDAFLAGTGPTLDLDLGVGMGEINVRRASGS